MNRFLKLFAILMIFESPKINSQIVQKTPREIAQISFLSTALLTMEDSNGQPLSLGSGFVIDNGVIATNYHVIENSKGGFIKIIGNPKKYRITGIIEISEKYDLAILKIEGLIAPKLKFGNFSQSEIGDNIYAIGNPRGLEGTFSQGIISGIRDIEGAKMLQITAPISPGSSGGPVLNSNGEVIGVAVASVKNGQNLNFAIPITYLNDLYNNSLKIQKPFSSISKTGEKSVYSNLGDNVITEVIGTSFAWNDNPYMGYYTFTIRNNLDYAIKNVFCLVIFFDKENQPIEVEYVLMNDLVPAKLAKRTERQGRLEPDQVRNLTQSYIIRVLDFEIVD